ncbi:MAG: hypothetical protein JWN50_498 [Parcubacteria group bacterium]|nr:hypothetical protein [Parcubacteria group bacterium]
MRDLTFFPTLAEYEHFINTEIIKTEEFKTHPFYKGLVDFVIDHRSPIFFKASEEYEYAHFTQYFNFVLMRDHYASDSVSDMFFMHDMVHMAFDNPLNPRRLTKEYFTEIVNYNEYVASNDTEMLTYYRIPGLREKSLSYTILYDLLKEKYPEAPSINFLLKLRKSIVFENSDGGLGGHPDAEKVFAYLRKFKQNNVVWGDLWYNKMPEVPDPYYKKRPTLTLHDYEYILENYTSVRSEHRYQHNVLTNIQTALSLLGEKDIPQTFAECAEAVKRLEGRVIMEDVAKGFHEQYAKSKKPEIEANLTPPTK